MHIKNRTPSNKGQFRIQHNVNKFIYNCFTFFVRTEQQAFKKQNVNHFPNSSRKPAHPISDKVSSIH